MEIYTNVALWSNKIYYRGIKDGRRIMSKIDYNPALFVPSEVPTGYTSIFGEHFKKIGFDNIKAARQFVKDTEEISNLKVYGNQRYQYCYIADNFPGSIDWDISYLKIANIDIEVGSENGFPEPDSADEPLTAITVKMCGVFTTFACGEFDNTSDNVIYVQCKDETDLATRFINWWSADHPDIITGWNVLNFDIPYLVNRIRKLLGDKVSSFSPWNVILDKCIDLGNNRNVNSYSILGIAVLDMLDLYQRYGKEGKSQDSYKLDNIAHTVLGERKLSYEEYGSLHKLYKENFQKFIEYNIKDVDLVDRIDSQEGLISLALTLAYDNKCNYEDVFQQVRMWDVICFNYFKEHKKVFPPSERHEKAEAYVGAYVKDPIVGFHNWVVSFDVASEYPSIIMGSNISPETIINPPDYTEDMTRVLFSQGSVSPDRLLKEQPDWITKLLVKDNVCLTANGQLYRRDKQGFMPALTERMFKDRKKYKKRMLELEQEYEDESDVEKKLLLKKEVSKYNNLQLSKKVSLNSLYGALGSKYFRFFDLRNAIAVTLTGQFTIRWVENAVNQCLSNITKETIDHVIAVDTDSLYINLSGLVSKTFAETPETNKTIRFLDKVCETLLQPIIDKACDSLGKFTNVFEQKIFLKREVLADKAIWVAKKRYILNVHNSEGVQYTIPKKKTMGLEVKKSSTPSFCREKLSEAIDIIFVGGEIEIQKFIMDTKKEFKGRPLSEISFPRGINGLTKYASDRGVYGSGTPIHVRGALLYNHKIKELELQNKYPLIQNGGKIKFIYLKEPNILHSNIISFPEGGIPDEFGLAKNIDWELQFQKSIVDPLCMILLPIGWKPKKTASLY